MNLRYLIAILTFSVIAAAAPVTEDFFGFATGNTGASNYQAMLKMEEYCNTNATVDILFSAGTYNVTLPSSGDGDYRGSYQGACQLTNASGTIDAAAAEFYSTNMVNKTMSMFALWQCTNLTINAAIKGDHTTTAGNGIKGVALWGSNNVITLNLRGTQLYDTVRIGNYEQYGDPNWYTGNNDIAVVCTNVDCNYGIAAYLSWDLDLFAYSYGTGDETTGSDRAVYITGCSNVVAYSYSRNVGTLDSVNIIGSAPSAVAPYHFGCSNVTLHAIDTGTTNYVVQKMVNVNIVDCTTKDTNITHTGLLIDVQVPLSDVGHTNSNFIGFNSCSSTNAAHVFSNITITGTIQRQTNNSSSTIYVASTTYVNGISLLSFTLDGFHDATDAGQKTIYLNNSDLPFIGYAYNCDLQDISLANPAIQTFTDYGNPYRRLNAGTINVGTLKGP